MICFGIKFSFRSYFVNPGRYSHEKRGRTYYIKTDSGASTYTGKQIVGGLEDYLNGNLEIDKETSKDE